MENCWARCKETQKDYSSSIKERPVDNQQQLLNMIQSMNETGSDKSYKKFLLAIYFVDSLNVS